MGKLRQIALILGEGPTEFFYYKDEIVKASVRRKKV